MMKNRRATYHKGKKVFSFFLAVALTATSCLNTAVFAGEAGDSSPRSVSLQISDEQIQKAMEAIGAGEAQPMDSGDWELPEQYLGCLEGELGGYYPVVSSEKDGYVWAVGMDADFSVLSVVYNNSPSSIDYNLEIEGWDISPADPFSTYTYATKILTEAELSELDPAFILDIVPATEDGTPALGTSGQVTSEDAYEVTYLCKEESAKELLPDSLGVQAFTLSPQAAQSLAAPLPLLDIPPALSVTATGYGDIYDGTAHGILVDAPQGASIAYGLSAANCTLANSPTYTNVGTYTIYYQVQKPGFETASGSQAVVITPATGMSITAMGYTGAYDGQPHGIVVNAPEGAIVQYGTTSGAVTASQSPTYTNTGTYTVFYKVDHSNYQAISGSVQIEITFARMPLTATSYLGAYDGQPHTIGVNAPEGATVTYGLVAGTYSLSEPPAYTDVGVNTLYFMVKCAGYSVTSGSATVTITTADNMPLSSVGYNGSYDGNAHGIAVDAPPGSTVTYGTDAGNYVLPTSPTYTTVGTRTVYYQVENPSYVTVTGSATVAISITTDLSIVATGFSGTYDAQPHGIVVAAREGSTITYGTAINSYTSNTSPTFTNVGTYTVYFRVQNPNAQAHTNSAIITILPAPSIAVTAVGYTGIYDETDHGITVSAPPDSTVKYGTSANSIVLNQSPVYKNVGTYTVYFLVEKENYAPYTSSATITIVASQRMPITKIGYTGAYDGQPHSIEIQAPAGAVVKYGLTGATCSSLINPEYTDVGEYTVYFQAILANYNNIYGSATVAIIASNNMTVTGVGYSGPYDTQPHGIAVNAPPGSTVTYGTTANTCVEATSLTYMEMGQYRVYYQVENPNYATIYGSAMVDIQKSTGMPFTSVGYLGAYDGQPHSITVTGPPNSVIKYGLTGSTASNLQNPSYTEVGNYKVFYQVINPNYNTIYGSAAINILPSTGMPVAVTGYTDVYDGNAWGITVSAPAGATIKYGVGLGSYPLTESPRYSTAGTYPVYYQVTHPSYATVTGVATVRIPKKNAYITVNSATKTVGQSDPLFSGSVAGLIGTDNLGTVTYSRLAGDTSKNDVGADITLTAAYTPNLNYNVIVTTAKLAITPSTSMNVTASGFTGDYDGKTHGIGVTAPTGSTVKYGTVSGTYSLTASPVYTNAGSYTVYYQVTQTGFSTVSGSAIVKINKIKASLVATNTTKVYGQNDPSFTGTNSGLVGTGDLGIIAYGRLAGDTSKNDVGADIVITASYTPNANYTVTVTPAKLTITPASNLSVTAAGFNGIYDGVAHGITVTAPTGSTVNYGTVLGTYNLAASPVHTNAGAYTVYYQVSNPNHYAVSGSTTVTIAKKTITVTANSAVYTYNRTMKTVSNIQSTQGLLTGHVLNGVTVPTVSQSMVGVYTVPVLSTGWSVTVGTTAVTANYTLATISGTMTILAPSYTPSTSGGTASPDTNPVAATKTIADAAVPLANNPTTIENQDTPRSALPKTGGSHTGDVSLLALVAVICVLHKQNKRK